MNSLGISLKVREVWFESGNFQFRADIDGYAKDGGLETVAFFTMILCTLKSLQMLITLLSEFVWVSYQKLALNDANYS